MLLELTVSQTYLGVPFSTPKRNTDLQKLFIFNATITGVIQEINVFVPLLCKGTEKKVSTVSDRMADTALINK